MRQYYADESTANPIWLFRTKGRFGTWETEGVFTSRKKAMAFGNRRRHHWGEYGKGWDVYSIALYDEALAIAVGQIRERDGDVDTDVKPDDRA